MDPTNISVRNMESLVQVVQELSLARDLSTVMRIVRRAARELTGADGATFVLRENGKCYYADEDAISPLWKGLRFPMETCISGWAMINKRAVAIDDIYQDDRIPQDAYRPTFVKSLAMVPIRTIEPIGAIGNYWADHRMPSEEQMKLLQSLADITAVTMENVTLYTELEQRVKDRTAELEAANKSLEAYSHSISHDLRAPLRAIRGFLSIVMENLGDEIVPQKENTDRIFYNVDHMEHLIEGMLQFSKLGQQKVRKTEVSMGSIVADLQEDFLVNNKQRDIQFEVGELPVIKADPTLIRQVWINLLSNAVKYTGKREQAVIRIGAEEHDTHVDYFVQDNGAGFDMAYADKLFGMFRRMHSQKDFEGIGIGLSLVQRIIEKHDGRIWADAVTDKGATFYFSLPR